MPGLTGAFFGVEADAEGDLLKHPLVGVRAGGFHGAADLLEPGRQRSGRGTPPVLSERGLTFLDPGGVEFGDGAVDPEGLAVALFGGDDGDDGHALGDHLAVMHGGPGAADYDPLHRAADWSLPRGAPAPVRAPPSPGPPRPSGAV